MKLYYFPIAPNPTKVLVYLAEKGIELEMVRVDLTRGEQRTPEHRARNPSGALPELELEDGSFHAVPLAIAVLSKSADKELARAFAAFAASDAGASAFRDNHYLVTGKKLRVGCGSSMRPPVEDLAALFTKRTGCEVLRNYGGSGTVLLQIEESKEGDIYICHDPFAYVCEDKGISKNERPRPS